MKIEVTLKQDEINKAVIEYLNRTGCLNGEFRIEQVFSSLNSYTFTDEKVVKAEVGYREATEGE